MVYFIVQLILIFIQKIKCIIQRLLSFQKWLIFLRKESACSSQIKGNIVTYVENTKSVPNSKRNFSSNKSLLPLALVKGKFSFGLLSSKKEISNATYTLFPTYEEVASAQYKYHSQRKLKKKISVGSKYKMLIKAEGRIGLKMTILGTKKHSKGPYSFTRQ